MMFDVSKINKFNISDLVNRTVEIRSLSEGDTEIVMGMDIETGELFVLDIKKKVPLVKPCVIRDF